MLYEQNFDLPPAIRNHLPAHAQDVRATRAGFLHPLGQPPARRCVDLSFRNEPVIKLVSGLKTAMLGYVVRSFGNHALPHIPDTGLRVRLNFTTQPDSRAGGHI